MDSNKNLSNKVEKNDTKINIGNSEKKLNEITNPKLKENLEKETNVLNEKYENEKKEVFKETKKELKEEIDEGIYIPEKPIDLKKIIADTIDDHDIYSIKFPINYNPTKDEIKKIDLYDLKEFLRY
jgi:hypothetical protein